MLRDFNNLQHRAYVSVDHYWKQELMPLRYLIGRHAIDEGKQLSPCLFSDKLLEYKMSVQL
jgi:hypothetical protein